MCDGILGCAHVASHTERRCKQRCARVCLLVICAISSLDRPMPAYICICKHLPCPSSCWHRGPKDRAPASLARRLWHGTFVSKSSYLQLGDYQTQNLPKSTKGAILNALQGQVPVQTSDRALNTLRGYVQRKRNDFKQVNDSTWYELYVTSSPRNSKISQIATSGSDNRRR